MLLAVGSARRHVRFVFIESAVAAWFRQAPFPWMVLSSATGL